MTQHFNLVTKVHKTEEISDFLRIKLPDSFVAVSQVTFTINLGNLRPSTLKELWAEDFPEELQQYIAQMYFELLGEDIVDEMLNPEKG